MQCGPKRLVPIMQHCERRVCETVDTFFGAQQNNSAFQPNNIRKSGRAAWLNYLIPIWISNMLNRKLAGLVSRSALASNAHPGMSYKSLLHQLICIVLTSFTRSRTKAQILQYRWWNNILGNYIQDSLSFLRTDMKKDKLRGIMLQFLNLESTKITKPFCSVINVLLYYSSNKLERFKWQIKRLGKRFSSKFKALRKLYNRCVCIRDVPIRLF